jgi:TRAP-type C4-dicarboxylate transport system substrate-binding protein
VKKVYVGLFSLCFLLVMVSVTLLAACSQPSPSPAPVSSPAPTQAPLPRPTSSASSPTSASAAKPAQLITMNWVSINPASQINVKNLQKAFFDRVNDQAKGELVVNYRGGPETIVAADQGKAVQSGVIDFAQPTIGSYEPLVPGVGCISLTRVTASDERKAGGAYDYILDMHKKAGLFYLGRAMYTNEDYFYMFGNKKVLTQKDFAGLKIGGATSARAPAAGWGGTYVALAMEDYYTAMERHMVDVIAGVPLTSILGPGLQQVSRYIIDHPFYQSTGALIMNMDSYNRLSPRVQQILKDAAVQTEKDQATWYADDKVKMAKQLTDAKVEFYKFSPEVAKWFVDTAYGAAWDFQAQRFPDVTAKLKALLTK